MTITQTVDIPANHRLTIDVPREVPEGRATIVFFPTSDREYELPDEDGLNYEGECPICAAHRDPVTGEELFNEKTKAAIREGRAMMRGEIPSKLYTSFDEMLADLDADD